MAEYINKKDILRLLTSSSVWTGLDAIARVNAMDSIDIVFCKECRYCKMKRGTFKGEPIIFYRCTENNRDVENDDYCSYGERDDTRQ